MTKTKRRRERIAVRVRNGLPVLADSYAASVWRGRKFSEGVVLMAEFFQVRSPGFNKLAHRIGTLVVRNVESFENLNAHQALKRLQWESGVGCETMGVRSGGQWFEVRQALSFSFDEMDESEFREIVRGLCRHIVKEYWPDLTPEQVEEMATSMPEEV